MADNVSALISSSISHDGVELLHKLGALAESRGTRAFVVGGFVRDLFIGRPSEDLDVVVEENAVDFTEAAVRSLGGETKAHTRFGTVILVMPSGRKVDLATSRSETYERPGALPVVKAGDIEQDLLRRDFTINAMAVLLNPPDFGTLFDCGRGRQDIKDRVLRVLTARSFEDDPTRVLRGIRFSARFGMRFEPETERLLRRAVAERRTDTVSGERLLNEFRLIMREGDPVAPVRLLIDWGVLPSIVAGWDVPATQAELMRDVLGLIERTPSDDLRGMADRSQALMLALLAPVPETLRAAILERLAAGRKLRALARELAAFERDLRSALSDASDLSRSAIYRMLRGYSPETLVVAQADFPDSAAAECLALYASELWSVSTEIDGAALADMGISEGRQVGTVLDAVLDARLDGLVTSRGEEEALARRLALNLTRGETTDNVSDDGGADAAD
jgi:tRNA nucleotidyltransferase (CCA-adding enzyme)